MSTSNIPWEFHGKKIVELINELKSFDENVFVELSLDGGATSRPISLVGKKNGKCLLIFIDAEDA